MTEMQKKQIVANIRKKDNMYYWDTIDELTVGFVNELLKKSYCEITHGDETIPFENNEEYVYEEDEFVPIIEEDILWDVTADVRDAVIALLEEEYKAFFPYVEEEY